MIEILQFDTYEEYQEWKEENQDANILPLKGKDDKTILVGVIVNDWKM